MLLSIENLGVSYDSRLYHWGEWRWKKHHLASDISAGSGRSG
jgi:hypothetical protein